MNNLPTIPDYIDVLDIQTVCITIPREKLSNRITVTSKEKALFRRNGTVIDAFCERGKDIPNDTEVIVASLREFQMFLTFGETEASTYLSPHIRGEPITTITGEKLYSVSLSITFSVDRDDRNNIEKLLEINSAERDRITVADVAKALDANLSIRDFTAAAESTNGKSIRFDEPRRKRIEENLTLAAESVLRKWGIVLNNMVLHIMKTSRDEELELPEEERAARARHEKEIRDLKREREKRRVKDENRLEELKMQKERAVEEGLIEDIKIGIDENQRAILLKRKREEAEYAEKLAEIESRISNIKTKTPPQRSGRGGSKRTPWLFGGIGVIGVIAVVVVIAALAINRSPQMETDPPPIVQATSTLVPAPAAPTPTPRPSPMDTPIPPPPTSTPAPTPIFSGTVRASDYPSGVPDGTEIVARVGDYISPAAVVKDGRYVIYVNPDNPEYIGRDIAFYIGDVQAVTTVRFEGGGEVPLDLLFADRIAPTPIPTPSPTPPPVPTPTSVLAPPVPSVSAPPVPSVSAPSVRRPRVYDITIRESKSSAEGSIGYEGDIDWFRFFAVQGYEYTFETDLDGLSDSVIRLYDGGPSDSRITELLEEDDQGGRGNASKIVWTANRSGELYIAVSGYEDEMGGYDLEYSYREPIPPTSVLTPTPPAEIDIKHTTISAGLFHTCGLREDNTVACWGNDDFAQSSPPSGIFQTVSTGRFHTCGLMEDNTVACWGDDLWGESSPPSGIFQTVSAGLFHTCGLNGR